MFTCIIYLVILICSFLQTKNVYEINRLYLPSSVGDQLLYNCGAPIHVNVRVEEMQEDIWEIMKWCLEEKAQNLNVHKTTLLSP